MAALMWLPVASVCDSDCPAVVEAAGDVLLSTMKSLLIMYLRFIISKPCLFSKTSICKQQFYALINLTTCGIKFHTHRVLYMIG